MKNKLNVLFVEDSPDDLEIFLLLFSKNGYDISWKRVQKEQELIKELNNDWDIVVCDYKIPGFSGLEALKIIRSNNAFLPVIIVSGTMGEQQAVETLKAGASDYLMKDKLLKLIPAVEKALNEKKNEKENYYSQIMIKESEERFRGIIENSNAGYFHFDNFGNLQNANNAFLNLYKYKNLSDIFGMHYSKFFLCDDLKEVNKIINLVLKGRLVQSIDFKRKCNDGTLGFQTCSLSPVRKRGVIAGVEGFVIDITEKKQVEENLKRSEQEKKFLLNTITESIVYFDKDLNIVWTNRKPVKNNRKELTEKYSCHKMFFGENERCDNCPVIKSLETKEIHEREYSDENENYYLVRAYPILDKNGEVINIIEVAWDLTQRKKVEKELELAKQKAEESDKLKTAFLSNMSHEIRTPMNAVLGFSQLLIKDDLGKLEKEMYIDYIKRNGESLVKIIDDIIDISKIQSQQLVIRKRGFNLLNLLNELYIYYRNELEGYTEKKIELKVDFQCDGEDKFFIETDEIRLKQVLTNLISNAIKYTTKGEVIFGFRIENKDLLFFVRDTGIGIHKENLQNIFKRFVQFSKEYISREFGTGLGLSISKELVDLLGGNLQVKSTFGKGSEFYFNIPYEKVKPINVAGNMMKAERTKYNWNNYKILIVDDEESNYVLTKRILKDTGASIFWAKDGQQAVNESKTGNYQLILMDIKMPNMDGIEATKQIRKNDQQIPIIIQTAYAVQTEREKSENAGCTDYFVKPIAIDEFLRKVNKHLRSYKNSEN